MWQIHFLLDLILLAPSNYNSKQDIQTTHKTAACDDKHYTPTHTMSHTMCIRYIFAQWHVD